MIRIISASDEKDAKLGSYFENSQTDIKLFLEGQSLLDGYIPMPSRLCNPAYVELVISKYSDKPFIFVAYTHGNEKALISQKKEFVSVQNSCSFKNSLFYSTACLVGKELAPSLIENDCKAFVGFTEESIVYESEYRKSVSINCENSIIEEFLCGDATLREAYNSMISYYNQQIDKFTEVNDMLFASNLVSNREALVLLGDENLKKEDFSIEDA